MASKTRVSSKNKDFTLSTPINSTPSPVYALISALIYQRETCYSKVYLWVYFDIRINSCFNVADKEKFIKSLTTWEEFHQTRLSTAQTEKDEPGENSIFKRSNDQCTRTHIRLLTRISSFLFWSLYFLSSSRPQPWHVGWYCLPQCRKPSNYGFEFSADVNFLLVGLINSTNHGAGELNAVHRIPYIIYLWLVLFGW